MNNIDTISHHSALTGQHHAAGFTLIEITIVLLVVGLLLGGMVRPLGMQVERSQRNQTREVMDTGLKAIYGFALSYGRLPCPDTDRDGQEDLNGNRCRSVNGFLPGVTLSTAWEDAWGQPLIYRVSDKFADRIDGTGCGTATANISFSLCSEGDIQVLNQRGGGQVAQKLPAIIVSKGRNFSRATPDERENSNKDRIFVDRIYSDRAGAEFDDLLTWVVPGILMNKMVDAGRLP